MRTVSLSRLRAVKLEREWVGEVLEKNILPWFAWHLHAKRAVQKILPGGVDILDWGLNVSLSPYNPSRLHIRPPLNALVHN